MVNNPFINFKTSYMIDIFIHKDKLTNFNASNYQYNLTSMLDDMKE